jgi:cytoplasmic iron level regulating protein YaaA (DUF328/UPF0246 family)
MAATLPLILLPPSEGKALGGTGDPWTPGAMAIDLDVQRRTVIAALATAMRAGEAERAKLLGVSGRALADASAADRRVTKTPTLPAIERYTGVLYDALDHRSLTQAQRNRLAASVVIVSGLWGAVMPDDPVPAYRLKMSAVLPRLGKLSTWWREPLTEALVERARGRPIWNLLPKEHDAAWAPPADREQYVVRFLDRQADGSLLAVSHDNKSLKGALIRYLVEHPNARPADLAGWKHPARYRYSARASDRAGATTIVAMVRR